MIFRRSASTSADFIDVKELIRTLSDEQLLASADAYFAQMSLESEQCWKPFSNPRDSGRLTQNLGLLLQAADLFQGCSVLDFGCATGWFTLGLADMGCHAVGVDVAPSALRLAEQLLERRGSPPRGSVRFAQTAGHALPLENDSVDRILCFDSFHHVKDQAATLREFARVLRPGGRIAMLEPGPYHSRTEQSQQEMRNFGVIENDVALPDIADHAQACGLDRPQVLVQFHEPLRMPLDKFVAWGRSGLGGSEAKELGGKLAKQLFNLQCFYFTKGQGVPDSRDARGLAARLTLLSAEASQADSSAMHVRVRIRNTGEAVWLCDGVVGAGTVHLGLQLWSRAAGTPTNQDFQRVSLSREKIRPGEDVEIGFDVRIAGLPPSIIRIDLVSEYVAWFSQLGRCTPLELKTG
jgi:SAM-dependent methyltransferase